MTDYTTRLDPEVRAFIARTDSLYDPDTARRPMAEQRRAYDRLCAAFRQGYPEGVTARDARLGGVPCRRYTPPAPRAGTVVLYFHGGGFVLGGLESHDDICAELAAATGLSLVSADYRLAPEHLHPAQVEDALAVLDALLAEGSDRVILAGDSAGGTVAALAAQARKGPRLAGQVLIYPALGGDSGAGSALTHAYAPMLSREDLLFYETVRFGPDAGRGPDTAWPLRSGGFADLPPAAVFPAECDPLHDDGPAYAARLSAAGVPARSVTGRGLVHGWLRARHMSARAAEEFAVIAAAIAGFAR